MIILAFETSTDLASSALWHDGQVTSVNCPRLAGQEGQHSTTLLPAVKQLLLRVGVTFQELDAIAFGAGPGAFTGLRMACALAQGIAVAHDKPVLPISTLEALALQARDHPEFKNAPVSLSQITALLDARMGEVYSAQFKCSVEGLTQVNDVILQSSAGLLSQPGYLGGAYPQLLCGNVFSEYPELANAQQCNHTFVLPNLFPRASEVATLATSAFSKGLAIDPAQAVPIYVRDRVAKTIEERLAEGGRA
jgi:tRNA threonylcarbamoyladenosine biosynthesis protein TsaB